MTLGSDQKFGEHQKQLKLSQQTAGNIVNICGKPIGNGRRVSDPSWKLIGNCGLPLGHDPPCRCTEDRIGTGAQNPTQEVFDFLNKPEPLAEDITDEKMRKPWMSEGGIVGDADC